MHTEIILTILGMAIVTFLTRFSFIALFRKFTFTERFKDWLRYIPMSILCTLIVPSILLPRGKLEFGFQNEYLIAAIVSCFIAYKTKNIIITVISGMAVILLCKFVIFRFFIP